MSYNLGRNISEAPKQSNREIVKHHQMLTYHWKLVGGKIGRKSPNRAGTMSSLLIWTLPTFRARQIFLPEISIFIVCGMFTSKVSQALGSLFSRDPSGAGAGQILRFQLEHSTKA